jgi:hypothetical protein
MNPKPLLEEPACVPVKLSKLPFATVSIQIGEERVSFRVIRWNSRKLMVRGKAQAASTIGRRVALILEAML